MTTSWASEMSAARAYLRARYVIVMVGKATSGRATPLLLAVAMMICQTCSSDHAGGGGSGGGGRQDAGAQDRKGS